MTGLDRRRRPVEILRSCQTHRPREVSMQGNDPTDPTDPTAPTDPTDSTAVESTWRDRWRAEGLFRADPEASRPTYCIVLPPPTLSARLHFGHLAWCLVQDAQ